MLSRAFLLPPCVALLLVPSCVDDLRTEGDVPAQPGAIQPETSGSSISTDEACSRLADAESKARKSLDCAKSTLPGCPERLRFAGSFVCAEVDEGTVDACVAAIGDYVACEDFDTRPCIVTVVRDTCVNATEAGTVEPVDSGTPDSSVPEEGGTEGGSTVPEASVGDAQTTDGATVSDARAD